MQNIPALKNIIQYPQLAPLPADFLTTMEEYVREAPKEVDPSSGSPRKGAGALAGNKVSNMAARGGTTSSAFAGGSHALSPPPGEVRTPGTPTQQQREAAEAAAAAAAAAAEEAARSQAVKMPEIDLLSFDDEPAPATSAAPAAAAPQPGELDFLADGMTAQQQQQQQDGFGEPAAFGQDGAAMGQQNPYAMYPQGPYAGPTGAYPGPYAGPTGYGMDPYGNPFAGGMYGAGPYAGPTGMGPQSMAIVPVGPMVGGMNMAMVPYGMGPFAGPTGALAPANPAANPFNPFLAVAPPAAAPTVGPVRLENDPLNELTEDLLGPPKAKKGLEAHTPSLNEIKQARHSDRQVPETQH
eukprot:GHUV01003425.1.p1 GENE.GHUV01003425.1~~GHUV01003425.1.p1  ORF type:complete len:399 (+),score=175.32 GHUV01003425.1:140-1198(+)